MTAAEAREELETAIWRTDPASHVAALDEGIVRMWPCCGHCEHDADENPYHTEPCWCQEGPEADE